MEPKKPYYAVIFTSITTEDGKGYSEMAQRMESLAKKQTGFLGFESARDQMGISVSYWDSLKAIADWKAQADHLFAQKKRHGRMVQMVQGPYLFGGKGI